MKTNNEHLYDISAKINVQTEKLDNNFTNLNIKADEILNQKQNLMPNEYYEKQITRLNSQLKTANSTIVNLRDEISNLNEKYSDVKLLEQKYKNIISQLQTDLNKSGDYYNKYLDKCTEVKKLNEEIRKLVNWVPGDTMLNKYKYNYEVLGVKYFMNEIERLKKRNEELKELLANKNNIEQRKIQNTYNFNQNVTSSHNQQTCCCR